MCMLSAGSDRMNLRLSAHSIRVTRGLANAITLDREALLMAIMVFHTDLCVAPQGISLPVARDLVALVHFLASVYDRVQC